MVLLSCHAGLVLEGAIVSQGPIAEYMGCGSVQLSHRTTLVVVVLSDNHRSPVFIEINSSRTILRNLVAAIQAW